MRVIIRRPHAYVFLDDLFADEGGIARASSAGCETRSGRVVPLPGLYVLDAEGGLLDMSSMNDEDELLELLGGSRADGGEEEATDLESASIRVSGFMAAEGIT